MSDAPGVDAAIQRRKESEAASRVHDRHYTEWVPVLNELRAEKNDEEGLALLMECIAAAERSARIVGQEPAPGYTRRAAVILRRLGRLEEEVELIERWERACPPRYIGTPDNPHSLTKRKMKALALIAKWDA